jgi:uncharacterized membrane protein YhdT
MRQLVLLIAISLAYGAGVLAMVAMRRDLHELPMGWLLGAGLAWLLGFVVPAYLATVPRPGAMMPRWKPAGIASIVASLAFIGLGLSIDPTGQATASAGAGWGQLWRGYGCLGTGLAAAIVPVIVGAIVLRRTLPVGSRWIAAALGASAGSLGGLVLHLHCPITEGLHVGLVHGAVVGVAALLAAALVPRAIDVR